MMNFLKFRLFKKIFFTKLAGGGSTQKSISRFPTDTRGWPMPNLVGIPPGVWAPNPNKQTSKQTDRHLSSLYPTKHLIVCWVWGLTMLKGCRHWSLSLPGEVRASSAQAQRKIKLPPILKLRFSTLITSWASAKQANFWKVLLGRW